MDLATLNAAGLPERSSTSGVRRHSAGYRADERTSLLDQEAGPHTDTAYLGETTRFSPHSRHTTHLVDYLKARGRWTPESSRNTAGWSVLVVSAFANIGPASCLVVTQPAGGLVISLISFAVFGALSLHGAHITAAAMHLTDSTTLPSLWRATVGSRTVAVPILCISLSCFAICVGYANIYGHLFAEVVDVNPIPRLVSSSHNFWVLVFAACPLAFLVTLKDISLMWYGTIVAGVSCFFTLLVVVWRWLDGSYTPGSVVHHVAKWKSHSHQHLKDMYEFHHNEIQLLSTLSVVYLMHFNAAKYYSELKRQSKDRYTNGVTCAMVLGFGIVTTTMTCTFLTFGSKGRKISLDNYDSDDKLAIIARIALSLGLMGCFPLVFSGMREAIIELLCDVFPTGRDIFERVAFQNIFSLALLVIMVSVACAGNRVDVMIISFGRSTFGSLLIYTIPGCVYLGATRAKQVQIPLPQMLVIVGSIVFGIFVSAASILVWLTRIETQWGRMGPT